MQKLNEVNEMILILCGKSGCGKDTLFKKLVDEDRLFSPIISTTTRPMRKGEKEGREYYFTDEATFKSRNDEWIECREYNTKVDGKDVTWYYGSPLVDINAATNYAVILDVEGIHDYINAYGKDKLCIVMIETDDKIRTERAKRRGGFNQKEWENRMIDDDREFSEDRTSEVVDDVIKNNTTIEAAYKDMIMFLNKYIKK